MKCPKCATENPDNANFCFNCATSLTDSQPSVVEDRFTKYIPKALLKKLDESAKYGGIENERRIVSILFCDVVGSTKHAESMDPEEWAEIINFAFDSIIPPVFKYEGMLARLMGDAILAFFGAPINHEDDPERAVLAGIDILEAVKVTSVEIKAKWGIDINVRVGINTGLVVVGEVGSDMRVEYTAMGDAINVAARMESTAETGTVQISQNTFKHVSYLFDIEKIGKIEVKGKSQPITTYRIIKEKAIVDKSKKYTDSQTVFVGREEEFDVLNTQIDEVTSGTGKIFWLSGEAGIGKSRLVTEFYNSLFLEDRVHPPFHQMDPSEDKIYWFETEALPYQKSSPYSPIITFFQKYFGITIDMDNEEKYNLVKTGLQYLDNPDNIIPYISSLLQIELPEKDSYLLAFLDPGGLQESIFDSIVSFLDTFSKSSTLILVFDDIQWADNSSLQLMKHLLKLVKSNKIFMIILSRVSPNSMIELYQQIMSDFGNDFQMKELQHLSEFGTSSLISNILKVENLPEDVREKIISRSQGNPFYVEELVRSFIENEVLVKEDNKWVLKADASKLVIPETLTNLLMTRLDKLDEKSKRVAQSASVIGREFLFPILQCINDANIELSDSISQLQDREWIVEKYIDTDKSYLFKHVLSKDVAYNSLLIRRRKEIHQKIATCLKNIDESLVDDIGRHLFEAEEFDEAIPFIIKAAETALSTNSTSEAISMLSQIEEYSGKVTDFTKLISTYVALGTAYAMQGKTDDSTKYYSSLLTKSKETNNRHGEVRALNKLAENAIYLSDDAKKADEYLQEAEEIATIIDFTEGLLENSATRCVMHQSLGEFDKSAEYEVKGMEISDSLNNDFTKASFKYNLLVSYVLSLQHEKAEQHIHEFFKEYEPQGETYFVSSIYAYLYSSVLFLKGNIKEAIVASEKGLKMAMETNAPFPKYLANRSLGEMNLFLGNFTESEKQFEKCVIDSSKHMVFGFLATSKLSLAGTKLATGRIDEQLIDEGRMDMDRHLGTFWGARSWGELGYYYLHSNNYEESRKYFELALTKPNAPYFIFRPYNLMGKIRLCFAEGKLDEAANLISELADYCKDKNLPVYNPEIDYLSGLLDFKKNNFSDALTKFNDAYTQASEYGQKQLLLEIISYMIKTQTSLSMELSPENLNQQFTDLIEEQASQFQDEEKKTAYLESIEHLQ